MSGEKRVILWDGRGNHTALERVDGELVLIIFTYHDGKSERMTLEPRQLEALGITLADS